MANCLQFALSNPNPGMEDAFNIWYGGSHFEHGIATPGILGGQRFKRTEGPWPSGKHGYLMIWEIDDPKYALEQLARVKGGDDMPISPAIDMNGVQPPTMWKRASVRSSARYAGDSRSRGTVVFVLVNAAEGESAQFESALLGGALAKLADAQGVIAADLLTLGEEQIRGNARKFAYGLLIELADEEQALAALPAVLNALPHCNHETKLAPVFRPLGGRKMGKQ
jgi:hypothetical protein